jgi:lysophospholipase L1-like esterase
VLQHGWGYAVLVPTSFQADNGAGLTKGIIGLCNRGQPRKPDDWGTLRAWAWGASRALDYLETDKSVDAKRVAIEGLSRYGKAALVTLTYEPRIAIGFIGSSGAGGAKLLRRNFGEQVENLASSSEYHWFCGNFLKYAGPLTSGDLPVDAHELIALCAPRPMLISVGSPKVEGNWIDGRGMFMAEVAAGPVYRLLGKKDLGTTEMPPMETALTDGDLAFRQHSGGHTTGPNWPTFLNFASRDFDSNANVGASRWSARWGGATRATQVSPLQEGASAAVPSPRTDHNSQLAHEQLVAKAKAGGIDLYFLGDSITRRWGCTDPQWAPMLENWKQNFFGWNAGNFGWGADRIQNILWRVQNGELDGVNPKVIVLLAGTNNVGTQVGDDAKVEDILKGFDALIATCREKAPAAKIIVTAIFPRNDNPAVVPEINRVNEELSKRADGETVVYLNVNDKLASPDGTLFDGMTVDKLHPTVKGFQVWADGLRPLLTKFLGPRAKTDHAPPPTGDPSVAKAG